MKVVCSKCGSEANSKCPVLRTIFPGDERESAFWYGMGFKLEDAGEGWKEGVKRLVVTMIVTPGESEDVAMMRLAKRMQSIPEDQMERYCCKHAYKHTVDCLFCSHKMVS